MSRWHYVFTIEEIEEVIRLLRKKGIQIEYKEDEDFKGMAMGYFEKDAGLIQSCQIWNKKDSERIFAAIGVRVKTCLLLRDSSLIFNKIVGIANHYLSVVSEREFLKVR